MIYQVMPALSQDEFKTLRDDIEARGVLIPVEYDEDGNILDGHHRVKACEELGITEWPRFVRKGLSEEEKRVHARQLNLARRHLNQSQKRDLIADQLKDTPEKSNRQIAASLGVDDKTVGAVRTDLVNGAEIPHHDTVIGRDGVKQPRRKPMRTALIPEASNMKEQVAVVKEHKAAKTAERHQERIVKIAEIANDNTKLDTSRRFPVIYADPPWKYDYAESESRAIENQYPTMDIGDICALPVNELASDDAVLFMWATAPKLREAFAVIDAWGFNYKTCAIWDKQKMGMGYYFRVQHELLMIATRGAIPAPLPDARERSVLSIPYSKHSAKPHEFYGIIEKMYPGLPKVELFCRTPQPGWSVWGNQSAPKAPDFVPSFLTAEAA